MTAWVTVAVLQSVVNGLAQGVALAAAVWLLLRALRSNAATRHAVWFAALAAIVVLPFLHMLEASQAEPAVSPMPASAAAPLAALLTIPAPGVWAVWLFAAWAAIAAVLLARVAWSYGSLRRLKRHAAPVGEEQQRRFEALVAAFPGRRAALAASAEIPVPVAAGLRNPVILIPEALLSELSAAELDQVLLHELAHVRRRDDWTNLFEKIAGAVFFFNPAVLWIARRLDLEREIACDDRVVSATGNVRPYALCLTRLVELAGLKRSPQLAPGAVARKPQITYRIDALLSRRRSASPRFSKLALAAGSGAVAVAGALAAWTAPVAVAMPAIASVPAAVGPIAAAAVAYAAPVQPPAVPAQRALAKPRFRRAAVPAHRAEHVIASRSAPVPQPQAGTVSGQLVVVQQVTWAAPRDPVAAYCVFYFGSSPGPVARAWVTIFWTPPPPPAAPRLKQA